VTTLIKMGPERELAATIARWMLDDGASMAEVRVRVNRECPSLDRGTKRWTLLELERERECVPGAVHSETEIVDTPGAGEGAQQHEIFPARRVQL